MSYNLDFKYLFCFVCTCITSVILMDGQLNSLRVFGHSRVCRAEYRCSRPTEVKSGRLRPVPNLINTAHSEPGRKFRKTQLFGQIFHSKNVSILASQRIRYRYVLRIVRLGKLTNVLMALQARWCTATYLINNETKIAVRLLPLMTKREFC